MKDTACLKDAEVKKKNNRLWYRKFWPTVNELPTQLENNILVVVPWAVTSYVASRPAGSMQPAHRSHDVARTKFSATGNALAIFSATGNTCAATTATTFATGDIIFEARGWVWLQSLRGRRVNNWSQIWSRSTPERFRESFITLKGHLRYFFWPHQILCISISCYKEMCSYF